MSKRILVSIIVLLILVGAIFLIKDSVIKTGNTAKGTANENANIKEFVIESYTEIIDGKYYPKFSPNEITVNKGDKVRIKITNIKGTHDFKIDEFGVYTETPLNQEMTVEFIADKSGSFEYYCTKPGHRQNGHWGTLKVLDK